MEPTRDWDEHRCGLVWCACRDIPKKPDCRSCLCGQEAAVCLGLMSITPTAVMLRFPPASPDFPRLACASLKRQPHRPPETVGRPTQAEVPPMVEYCRMTK